MAKEQAHGREGPVWISCQLGSRDHYAVPRALHANGQLGALVTDMWFPPDTLWAKSDVVRLLARHDSELGGARVMSLNLEAIKFESELARQTGDSDPWDGIMRRNRWFQPHAVRRLQILAQELKGRAVVLFLYNYAARDLLQFARDEGWRTVLGAIDPGPQEERIVRCLEDKYPAMVDRSGAAPGGYWENWRNECLLADRIVVNSQHSAKALSDEGVPEGKIAIVPLAYEAPAAAKSFQRRYPRHFSPERPMNVLFLGQISLRKGVAELFDAIRELGDAPVHFRFVGNRHLLVPADMESNPKISWVGNVPRDRTGPHFKAADVFVLPTHSDGFALTQLEAQSWSLPIIASRNCGEVIRDGYNGRVLDEVTSAAIASNLRACVECPEILEGYSARALKADEFSLAGLGVRLNKL